MILWTYATMKVRRDSREKETVAHYLSRGGDIIECDYYPGEERKLTMPKGRQMIGSPQGCLSTSVICGI